MTIETQDSTVLASQTEDRRPKACPPCGTGTTSLLAGAGIGAYGVAGYFAAGSFCPICVVAAPALIGAGLYLKTRHKRKNKESAPY